MALIIRRARDSDLPAIVAIYNEAVEETESTFDVAPFSVAERRPWFVQFGDEDPLFVASDEGVVAGFAYYLPYRPRAAYSRTKEVAVYVARVAHGRGLGTKLYEQLVSHAKGRRVHALLAVVAGDNPRSVALHRKLGFVSVGHLREVGHKFGRWVDTRFFQLLLDSE